MLYLRTLNSKQNKMKISNRAEIMPSSPIRKLSGIAQKIEAEGIKVYHLNIGQPDLPTPQVGLDALKQIDRDILEWNIPERYPF